MKRYQLVIAVLILLLVATSFNYVTLAQTVSEETNLTQPVETDSLSERVQRDFEVIYSLLDNIRQQAALEEESRLPDLSAKTLVSLSHAPKGYPLQQKVGVTSVFGWRDSIMSEIEKEKETSTQAGKGGNAVVTQTVVPAPQTTAVATPVATTPASVPAANPTATSTPNATVTEEATTQPSVTATPVVTTPPGATTTPLAATMQATPEANPTQPAANPTQPAANPTSPTPAATGKTVSLWGNEVVVTQTAVPTPTPTATPTPVITKEFHSGIDLAAHEGMQVVATADGIVEYAGSERGGYGLVVFINHAGSFTTIYGHNSRLLVKAGQRVKTGDVIAISGNTGYSTGPHLHYEIRFRGQAVDPAPFLEAALEKEAQD